MTKPNCTAVGTVIRVAQVPASERAKPFTSVDIETAPEERSGKGYKMRVSIRVAGECPSACVQGALVSISGPGSLTTFEHNGKHYPKLTIYGRPEVMGGRDPREPGGDKWGNVDDPVKNSPPLGRPKPTSADHAAAAEDDVPF